MLMPNTCLFALWFQNIWYTAFALDSTSVLYFSYRTLFFGITERELLLFFLNQSRFVHEILYIEISEVYKIDIILPYFVIKTMHHILSSVFKWLLAKLVALNNTFRLYFILFTFVWVFLLSLLLFFFHTSLKFVRKCLVFFTCNNLLLSTLIQSTLVLFMFVCI